MKKIIYLIIGSLSLVLGLLGVILPIVPTTPFLLLTSFCYAKGSDKFYIWFTSTKLYHEHLEDFVNERAMTLKSKILILTFASTMLLFPLILVDLWPVRLFIICLYLCKYYYFIFHIKTISN